MDPVACWNRLVDAVKDNDLDEAADAANDLRNWQNKGGYMPDAIPEGIGARLRDFAYVCHAIAHND